MRDKFDGDEIEEYKLGDDCMVQDCGCIIEINHREMKGIYTTYLNKLFGCPEHSRQ